MDVTASEKVIVAAASNKNNENENMKLLLDRRETDFVISERVLKVAAGNQRHGKESMNLLLDRRGTEVIITEEEMKAVAGNECNGKEVIILLLARREADVAITEEVVMTAASNNDGSAVIRLLYDCAELSVTERAIESAATSGRIDTPSLLGKLAGAGSATHDWMCIAQLWSAVKSGDAETILQLVQRDTPPEKGGGNDITPLFQAAYRGRERVVRIFLDTDAVKVIVKSTS